MRSTEALLESTDPRWIRVAGMVRRMAITLTSNVLWQLAGFRLPDGSREVLNAEPFTGAGFFSRPPSSGEPEAIVVNAGDANAPMIIAIRDEKTRAAIVGALKVGETAMYTDKALVYLKDDGTIEARSAGGVAQSLATKADLNALITAFNAHVHPVPGVTTGGGATTSSVIAAPRSPATGTTKLKGE